MQGNSVLPNGIGIAQLWQGINQHQQVRAVAECQKLGLEFYDRELAAKFWNDFEAYETARAEGNVAAMKEWAWSCLATIIDDANIRSREAV